MQLNAAPKMSVTNKAEIRRAMLCVSNRGGRKGFQIYFGSY